MKRAVVAALLGIAFTAPAFAQAHIGFSNYLIPPYNQVVWDEGPIVGGAVNDPSVEFQLYYAEGIITAETLMTPGVTFNIDPSLSYDPGAGFGPGGYFGTQVQVLPGWFPGVTYTFQIRVISYGSLGFPVDPNAPPRTLLWQESDQIVSAEAPAEFASQVPQFDIGLLQYPPLTTIPEPTTLTLLGLGSLALVMVRRRG